MEQEIRQVYYDPELTLEAYCFQGVDQGFPEHFHSHYVLGAVEDGRRRVTSEGEERLLQPGDLVIFNAGAIHTCGQVGEQALSWRGINVPAETMERAAEAVTGRAFRPRFSPWVLPGSELTGLLREVWALIAGGTGEFRKEEAFLLLTGRLLEECGGCPAAEPEERPEVRVVCAYLEEHCGRRITLEELAALAGLSKYHLLRCFTRQRGITPYRYLETVRVNRAKELLERGCAPAEAALETGFADQSHFTRCFKALIGLTPSQYRAVFHPGRGAGA